MLDLINNTIKQQTTLTVTRFKRNYQRIRIALNSSKNSRYHKSVRVKNSF